MTLLEALTDPYIMIRFLHLAGAIIAVGAVTVTDSMLALLHFKEGFADVLAKISKELSFMIWLGFLMLSTTGAYMLTVMPGILEGTVFQIKMFLVSVVFVNGIILNEKVNPRFEKISDDWDDEETRTHFERFAGIFAAISVIGWWSIIFLVYIKAYI